MPKAQVTVFRRASVLVCCLCSAITVLFTIYLFIVVARNGDLGDGEALFVFPSLVIISAIFGAPVAYLWPKKKKRVEPSIFD